MQLQSSISPDATRILSGSSDGNAYIWQVSFFYVCVVSKFDAYFIKLIGYVKPGKPTTRRSRHIEKP